MFGTTSFRRTQSLNPHLKSAHVSLCLSDYFGYQPIALGFFGGVIDYNKMGFMARKGMESSKPQLEKHGFKVAPDVYDLRNWDEIRNWAKELAKKSRE
ncbi:MAG: hypothetical protein QXY74_07485 [Candidatus Bathyarchaeia archaeon]